MKNLGRRIVFFLLVCTVSVGYAVTPPTVEITVREKAGGKIVKKRTTDANGNFTLGAFPAGAYTLEFRAKQSDNLKRQQFSIAVDGIKQSGKQGGISGNSLVGGVALSVEMAAASNVTGQVTTDTNSAAEKRKAPHNVGQFRTEDVNKLQEHADVSSNKILDYSR